ncbi:hypothetical protein SO802_019876 [Lithocarpus litseifolius]|uniref:Peptidase A1 domain-containing protein n=1 Tax=Lithocarpus litseifolius TaxID=425828 RepID=A0AAW2CR24_9ROSI
MASSWCRISPIIPIFVWFLLVFSLVCPVHSLETIKDRASNQTFQPNEGLKKLKIIAVRLSKINKPASPDGDIIDCVVSHLQPAFDHPQLKGQKPLNPPDRPKGHSPSGMLEENVQLRSLSGESCPDGTVPIKRTTEEDMLRASSVRRFGRKPKRHVRRDSSSNGHELAVGYVSGDQYYGAKVGINVWAPRVANQYEFSLSQIKCGSSLVHLAMTLTSLKLVGRLAQSCMGTTIVGSLLIGLVANLTHQLDEDGVYYPEMEHFKEDIGSDLESGESFIPVGLGTPPTPQYLVIDTGSDIGWQVADIRVAGLVYDSTSGTSGSLGLGREGIPTGAAWASLLSNKRAPSFYYIELVGLGAEGIRLPIREDVFQTSKSSHGVVIMDTGTTVSMFLKLVYEALCDAFVVKTMNGEFLVLHLLHPLLIYLLLKTSNKNKYRLRLIWLLSLWDMVSRIAEFILSFCQFLYFV